MLPDRCSPQAGRAVGLHSVSELARREPEPVLPSTKSAEAPFSGRGSALHLSKFNSGIPRGRELSLPAEPSPNEPMELFQIVFPHGDACERSASVPLSEMPLE